MPNRSETEQFEQIRTRIHETADAAAKALAAELGTLIRHREAEGRQAVLGLATGSTPVGLYRELIRMHREEGLSFAHVVTFNLDEYFGLEPDHPESYRRFMREQLFDHIDIPDDQTHVPDGRIPRNAVFDSCQAYEQRIRDAGGLDVQILGIGRTGHIGFNEPGSSRDSRTRLVTLDTLTRRDAARDFRGEAHVPRFAITMGVGTILEARRIVLLAWGVSKADVVARAVEASPTESLPASLLQGHPEVEFLLDPAAASSLTRSQHPWLVGPVKWTAPLLRKAVIWLSNKVSKPVLKLVDEDYSENGLADLLTSQSSAYELNIRIFNELQHTITGWPGGKPNADDANRPERARPAHKRVLILAPEPQDDVLGVGGTLNRLVRQGHDVTVAYMTSGNLAVPDEDAQRAIQLLRDVAREETTKNVGNTSRSSFIQRAEKLLREKTAFSEDGAEVRRLKGLIRRGEAWTACSGCGLRETQLRFLDLGFYERGRYRQFSPDQTDINAVAALLDAVRPHQIFVTGADTDPNSIPAVCFRLFHEAWQRRARAAWRRQARVWLYRSGEYEWPVHQIDMAVPLSPRELEAKIQSIYQHQTQRSQTPVSEHGHREIWQQAEARSQSAAAAYDAFGLAEYEAIEGFQRWA